MAGNIPCMHRVHVMGYLKGDIGDNGTQGITGTSHVMSP